jgi:hypothetical protein
VGAQFTFSGIPDYFETEASVTIVRRAESATDGKTITQTTIWGPASADLQFETGDTYIDPAGAVVKLDAMLFLYPVSGSLPSVAIDDIVQYGSQEMRVVFLQPWNFPPAHLEVGLRRGPQLFDGGSGAK